MNKKLALELSKMNTIVNVETKDKISRIKALQKEIQQLKNCYLKRVSMLWY